MEASGMTKSRPTRLGYYFLVLAVGWTIVVTMSLFFNINQKKKSTHDLATIELKTKFNNDQAFRLWAKSHGGVYVPTDKRTPPSPYLAHIPERDINTPSGKKLTLMNAAYMLRQLQEKSAELNMVTGRITSLKPLRRENTPDAWERKALEAFEHGVKEVVEYNDINGQSYLRMIRPMVTVKGCLKCHAFQGYKVGDIRGGIGVSVLMAPYLAQQRQEIIHLTLAYIPLWLIGLLGIGIGYRGLKARIEERNKAEKALQRAHNDLEIRVEERTAELSKTNLQLQQEIIERKKAEEERKKLQKHLLETQKLEAIATLAGGIAHEFNNALMGISGNIDLLQMDLPDDANARKYADSMRVSSHRMSNLTDRLLAYARGGKYQPKTTSLNNFVQQTLSILKHDINPAINIETNLSKDIYDLNADLTQLQMVLSAILTNATEAIEGKGVIRVSTMNKEINPEFAEDHFDLKPGSYVCLIVEDDGNGMDSETLSRMFEPFFTTKFQGRGLGMAATYGIIKNHDGLITVDSVPGKGTHMRIYLPAVETHGKEKERQTTKFNKGAGTVLIAEDEEVVMDVVVTMIKKLGFHSLSAKTGLEAIDIAKTFEGEIDVALLDIKLPDMEGSNVYPLLIKVRPNLKVIVNSGYSIDGPAQKILDAGAEDFIQKPFTVSELSEKLKKVLEVE